MTTGRFGRVAAVAALVVTLGAPARGQSLLDDGNGLEFRTDQPSTRLELAGRDRITGSSPLSVPGPVYGDFWLRANGPAVEPQQGRVRIHMDETGSRVATYGGPSKRELVLSSLLFPGYAQSRQHQQTKSFLMGTGGIVTLGWTAYSQIGMWNAEDDLETVREALQQASGPQQITLTQARSDAQRELDYAVERRNLALYTMAGAWGVSLVEAMFFSPRFDVTRSSESSLTLNMHRTSRLKATVGSLVFPGIGQNYNGQSKKAVWMACGGMLVAGFTLHRADAYNAAVKDFDIAESHLLNAGSVGDFEELETARDQAYQDVENAYRNRNVAFAITAGYWGLSALDALLQFGKPWGKNRPRSARSALEFKADPLGQSLAAEVRF